MRISKIFASAIVFALAITSLADARMLHGQYQPTGVVQDFLIGGGGNMLQVAIGADGTKIARNDTYGLYYYNPSSSSTCNGVTVAPGWQQVINTCTMPTGSLGSLTSGGCFDSADNCATFGGAAIAPTNSSHWYVILNQQMFATLNKGQSWTQCGGSAITGLATAMDAFNSAIAIDPANENIVYFSTPSGGLFVSTNGCANVSQVTAVGTGGAIAGTSNPVIYGGHLIAFDSVSSGCTTPVSGVSQCIYVSTYGTGVYHTITGGSLWTLTTSTPTTHRNLVVGHDGTVWLTDNSTGILNELAAGGTGSWANSGAGTGWRTVAVNPTNGSLVYVQAGSGMMKMTANGGSTWSSSNITPSLTATDIPWLTATYQGFFTTNHLAFDPNASNDLYVSQGTGIWKANPPQTLQSGGTIAWGSITAAIENMVTNWIVSPPGGDVAISLWDRCAFTPNGSTYPTTHGVTPMDSTLQSGWSIDYASSTPSTLVALCNGVETTSQSSGYSSNGGSTWQAFPTSVPNLAAGAGNGGCIAASTPNNILVIGSDSGSSPNQPYYTTDGGSTWNAITISGINTSGTTGWSANYFNDVQNCAADRVTPNKFYLYNSGTGTNANAGIYKATGPSLSSWTVAIANRLATGTSGFIGHQQMRAVPGQAGELWFTQGYQSEPHPAATPLYHCTDGSPMTCATISNIKEVTSLGFGRTASGSGYPVVYILGWANCGQSGINNCPGGASGYTFGVWRSFDTGVSWNYLFNGYPNGVADQLSVIEGDNNTYGKFYIGSTGMSIFEGQFN